MNTPPPQALDDAHSTATSEVMLPSRRGKALTALLCVAIAGIALLAFARVPSLLHAVQTGQPTPDTLRQLRLLTACTATTGIGCALYLMAHGRTIRRTGQCPPPASLVWRATPIVHGPAARKMGGWYLLAGATALPAVLGLTAYLWLKLGELDSPALPAGVTILRGTATPQ